MPDNREPDSHQAETDMAAEEASSVEKWEDPVLPPDDFNDKEASDDVGDEDADDEPKRGKSGVLMFAMLGAVALAGAGFAYLHFGNNGAVEAQKSVTTNTQEASAASKVPVQSAPLTSNAVTETSTGLVRGATETVVAQAPVVVEQPVVTTAPEVSAPSLPVTTNVDALTLPASGLPVLTPPTTIVPQVAENAGVLSIDQKNLPEGTSALPLESSTAPALPAVPSPSLPTEPSIPETATVQVTASEPSVVEAANKDPVVPAQMMEKLNVEVSALPKVEAVPTPSLTAQPVNTPEPSVSSAVNDNMAPSLKVDGEQSKIAGAGASVHKPSQDIVKPKTKAGSKVVEQQKKSVAAKIANAKTASKHNKKPSYSIRSIMAGEAWVVDNAHPDALQHVQVGDTLLGLGKVKAIREESDGWRVIGVSGTLHATNSEDR